MIIGVNLKSDCIRLDDVDYEIIDQVVNITENQTGNDYELIPVFINDGAHIGFLINVNSTGYTFIGFNEYKSIFQEK